MRGRYLWEVAEPLLSPSEKLDSFLLPPSCAHMAGKEGLAPINLIIEDNFHRAAPGGTGGVKTNGNYASVDGSTVSKQGLQFVFTDGSKIIFRISLQIMLGVMVLTKPLII